MAVSKKKRTKKKKAPRRFRFQLSLVEAAGIGIVAFCLFLWMFLLGIWAGQTILLPSGDSSRLPGLHRSKVSKLPAGTPRVIRPRTRKKTVAH